MKRAGNGTSVEPGDFKKPKVGDGAVNKGVPSMAPDQIKAMIENTKKQLELRKQHINAPRPPVANPVLPSVPMGQVGGFALSQSNALAAQLRAQVQAQLQAQQARLGVMGTPGLLAPGMPKDRSGPVRLDDQGRLVDAQGNLVQMRGRVTTLKANIHEQRAAEMKAAEESKPPDLTDNNPYYDPRVSVPKMERSKKMFHFVAPGKYENLANRMRAQAQVERLQNEIAQAAKKTGISWATKLALLTPKTTDLAIEVPDVEWWDAVILPTQSYDDLDQWETPEGANDMAVDSAEYESVLAPARSTLRGITNLIEHPVPLDPPAEPPKNIPIPVYLTKEEKRKIRRQRRKEAEQEKQEKIRMGLMPPPDAKLKISNLMRVLGDTAVMEPSRAEAKVREQMAKRREAHQAANKARKLTNEQRGAKRDKKLTEDLSIQCQVAIFRVRDLSDPAKRYKVDINAQQLKLTGCTLLSPDANAVIVEGGPKALKKYQALMLRRIKWSEDNVAPRDDQPGQEEEPNTCHLVWEGIVKERSFSDWKIEKFSQSQRVRDYLRKYHVEHYWDLVLTETIVATDVDSVL